MMPVYMTYKCDGCGFEQRSPHLEKEPLAFGRGFVEKLFFGPTPSGWHWHDGSLYCPVCVTTAYAAAVALMNLRILTDSVLRKWRDGQPLPPRISE